MAMQGKRIGGKCSGCHADKDFRFCNNSSHQSLSIVTLEASLKRNTGAQLMDRSMYRASDANRLHEKPE